MTRAQLNRLIGTAKVPDLWHFAPGGTLGANLGPQLFNATTEELDRLPGDDHCERCGRPCGGVVCDDCLDDVGAAERWRGFIATAQQEGR